MDAPSLDSVPLRSGISIDSSGSLADALLVTMASPPRAQPEHADVPQDPAASRVRVAAGMNELCDAASYVLHL